MDDGVRFGIQLRFAELPVANERGRRLPSSSAHTIQIARTRVLLSFFQGSLINFTRDLRSHLLR